MGKEHDTISEGKPSASTFDGSFRCLGKPALEAQMPPEKESKAASRGTTIHAALAISDLSGLAPSDSITASRCMYGESQIIAEYNFEGYQAWWEGHPDEGSNLPRLWEVGDDLEPEWSVQLDSTFLDGGKTRALVADYKTGFARTQPIETNWQVAAEVVAAATNPMSPVYGAKEVVGALIHPHHPDSLYETKVFREPEIVNLRETIRGYVYLLNTEKDLPRTPNEVSCTYCRAKGVCPEYKEQAKALMRAIKDEHEQRGYGDLLEMTPEERGNRMRQLKLLGDIIKAQKDRFVMLAQGDAEAIHGYRLTRKWDTKIKSDVDALQLSKQEFGELAAAQAMKFSLTALIDYLAKDMSKKEAGEIAKKKLAPVITFKKSDEYLVQIKV